MCDETLVTRIAEMANYFLDLLVGKKRKTLKVSLVNTPDVDGGHRPQSPGNLLTM